MQLLATVALSSVSFWSEGYKMWIRTNTWMLWVRWVRPEMGHDC